MSQRPSIKLPKYSLHKPSSNARVWSKSIQKHVYLGKYDSPESHREYDRLIRKYFPSEAKPEKSVAKKLLEQIEQGEISPARNPGISRQSRHRFRFSVRS
jgi:hypothetical protein